MNNGKRKTSLLLLMMFLLIVCGFSVSASSSEVTIDDLIIKQGDSISANSSMKYHTLSAHDGCGYIDSAGRERLFNAIYMANYGIDVYGPVQKYNALDDKSYWIYKYNDEEVPAEIFLPELYDIVITPEPYRTRATSYYLVLKIPEGKPVTAVPKLIRTSYRSVYNNGSTNVYETAALYYGGKVIRIKPDNTNTFFLIEWDLNDSNYTLPECTITPPDGMVFGQWNLGKSGDTIALTKTVTTLEPQWVYSINNASVTISDQTYTGKALTPDLTVTLSGKTLERGKDYTVTYSNNINVGTATATITGCGVYTGTISKTFKIMPATQPTTPEETSGSPHNASDISPEKPVRLEDVEKVIIAANNDNDQKGSTFSMLQAKGVPKSKSSIKLSWKRVNGATKYVIYGNKCGKGNKYKKFKEVAGVSFTQKKLKKGTYYKYLVVAVGGDKVLAVSKTIHVATKGGKVGNNTGVKLSKTMLSLKKGKSKTVKATLKAGSSKVKIHRKVAWESGNVSIATVSKKGKIKGVKKGTCYVYAYAQNGVFAKIKVTVK